MQWNIGVPLRQNWTMPVRVRRYLLFLATVVSFSLVNDDHLWLSIAGMLWGHLKKSSNITLSPHLWKKLQQHYIVHQSTSKIAISSQGQVLQIMCTCITKYTCILVAC